MYFRRFEQGRESLEEFVLKILTRKNGESMLLENVRIKLSCNTSSHSGRNKSLFSRCENLKASTRTECGYIMSQQIPRGLNILSFEVNKPEISIVSKRITYN
jgi:hypothetical protein